MNEKIFQMLNNQIKHEFYASYLYLSIASYFETIPLEGFSKWFRKQAEEEREHAMKIYDYVIDRNMHVDLQALEKPVVNFNSIEEVFALALKHEKKVTHWIHQIYEAAVEEKDHATHVFMQWFITEQVEEEKNAQDNLDQIVFAGDDKAAILILDQNLGKRVD